MTSLLLLIMNSVHSHHRGCTRRPGEPAGENEPGRENGIQEKQMNEKETESEEELSPMKPYASDLSDAEWRVGYVGHALRTRFFEKRETKEKRGGNVKWERACFLGKDAVLQCASAPGRGLRGARHGKSV
jgi:hypothetical protein